LLTSYADVDKKETTERSGIKLFHATKTADGSPVPLNKRIQFFATDDGDPPKIKWYRLYGEHNKPTPDEIGAATADHTHPEYENVDIDSVKDYVDAKIAGIRYTDIDAAWSQHDHTLDDLRKYTVDLLTVNAVKDNMLEDVPAGGTVSASVDNSTGTMTAKLQEGTYIVRVDAVSNTERISNSGFMNIYHPTRKSQTTTEAILGEHGVLRIVWAWAESDGSPDLRTCIVAYKNTSEFTHRITGIKFICLMGNI
jgi:hypothetical protein